MKCRCEPAYSIVVLHFHCKHLSISIFQFIHAYTHRERETHTERQRDRDRQTDRQTETERIQYSRKSIQAHKLHAALI